MIKIIELNAKEIAAVSGGMGILPGGCIPPKKFPKPTKFPKKLSD